MKSENRLFSFELPHIKKLIHTNDKQKYNRQNTLKLFLGN